MSDLHPIVPRQKVPALSFPLVGGGTWSVESANGASFDMVVFYRGLHCPICMPYLQNLEKLLPEFEKRGVSVVATSTDPQDRAERAKADWKLPNLALGYGVALADARRWGLFVSTSRGKTSIGIDEPALFAEPGIFFLKPDKTLYFSAIQTMPFARPRFDDFLPALDFVTAKDYPARGEVAEVGAAAAAAE